MDVLWNYSYRITDKNIFFSPMNSYFTENLLVLHLFNETKFEVMKLKYNDQDQSLLSKLN
jgi:hypothetical protein